MNYYIADLHLGHANAIGFDGRPFADVAEMNEALIHRWNSTVSRADTVYVLGDFIWEKESLWPAWLERLTGNKVLIRGSSVRRQSASFRILPITKRLPIPDGTSSCAIIQCPFTVRTMMRSASCCTATSTIPANMLFCRSSEKSFGNPIRNAAMHARSLSMWDVWCRGWTIRPERWMKFSMAMKLRQAHRRKAKAGLFISLRKAPVPMCSILRKRAE